MLKRISLMVPTAALLLTINACGGGGGDSSTPPTGNNPPNGGNNPPAEEMLALRGKLPEITGGADVRILVGDSEFSGAAEADGSFEVEINPDGLDEDLLVKLEASGKGDLTKIRYVSAVDSVGNLVSAAGDDDVVSISESPALDIDYMDIGDYAVRYVANGGKHVDKLGDFHVLGRDALDGDKVALLAADTALVGREGYALPEGAASSWDVITDFKLATKHLNDIRTGAIAAPKGSRVAQKSGSDVVEQTVEELIANADPFTAENIPVSYTLTQITRDLEDFKGGVLEFADGGTGKHITPAGTNDMSWEIVDGKLVITPAAGKIASFKTVSTFADSGVTYFTLKQEVIGPITFSRLRSGEYADVLNMNFGVRITSDDYPFGVFPPIERSFSKMVTAVKPSGHPAFTVEEVTGVWAMPSIAMTKLQGGNFAGQQIVPDAIHFPDDGILRFKSDNTGYNYMTGDAFSWEIDEHGALQLTFSDNSVMDIRKVRVDGAANDIAAFVVDPATGETYANGGYSVKLDLDSPPMFDAAEVAGTYGRFGLGEGTLEDYGVTPFTMVINDDGTADWRPDMFGSTKANKAWSVVFGDLYVDSIYDENMAATPDSDYPPYNPACSDVTKCWRIERQRLIPLVIDGDRIYTLEIHEVTQPDKTKDWWLGPVIMTESAITYWEKQ